MNQLIASIGGGQLRGILTYQGSRRKLVHLWGRDSYKILNSLSTKKIIDVKEADKFGDFSEYGVFMTSKGKTVSEALLLHRALSQTWFLDVPESSLQPLVEHINQYKMRNKFEIDVIDINKSYRIWSLVASDSKKFHELTLWLLNQTSILDLHFYPDPRWPFAFRLIAPSTLHPQDRLPQLGDIFIENDQSFTNGVEGDSIEHISDNPTQNNDFTFYDYFRILNGIPEAEYVTNTIPFESNVDMLNGIDYDKGCYLGQELIARTNFRGQVRKRMMPFISLGHSSSLSSFLNSTSSSSANSAFFESLNKRLEVSEDSILPKGIIKPIQFEKKTKEIPATTGFSKSMMPPSQAASSIKYELDMLYDMDRTKFNTKNPSNSSTFINPQLHHPLIPITHRQQIDDILSGKGLDQSIIDSWSSSLKAPSSRTDSWILPTPASTHLKNPTANVAMAMTRMFHWESMDMMVNVPMHKHSEADPHNVGLIGPAHNDDVLSAVPPWMPRSSDSIVGLAFCPDASNPKSGYFVRAVAPIWDKKFQEWNAAHSALAEAYHNL